MEIQQNIFLKPLTTFKIGGPAEYFCYVSTPDDIREALRFAGQKQLSRFILGGGSNILVSDAGLKGLVISPNPEGIKIIEDNAQEAVVDVAAGENWDNFVQFVIDKGWWGIENLSYVPGNAGAFAVQNVGAYGQEASDVVVHVEAFDCSTGQVTTIGNADCGFTYRHSIFNTTEKGRYIILNTRIRLTKQPSPNLSYPDLQKKFAAGSLPSLTQIREAIIEIRNRKYPFPTEAKGGNAGSFFQNPRLTEKVEQTLREKIQINFPAEVQKRFAEEEAKFKSRKIGLKVSAFLIDICGLKGIVNGGAKINENQPLVVLNTGTANSEDVMGLAQKVRAEVYSKTGVEIPIEPELVGFSEDSLSRYLNLGR